MAAANIGEEPSTIILERSPVSPMGIPGLDLSPWARTPLQSPDSSDETCMYCMILAELIQMTYTGHSAALESFSVCPKAYVFYCPMFCFYIK